MAITTLAKTVTLTLNPAIDVASHAETVRHTNKVRTFNERMDPGGGGINVARVLCRFEVPVRAIFLAGGSTGRVLDELIGRAGVDRNRVPISADTRMSLAVHECSTGLEYRFVPEGPVVKEPECRRVLEQVSVCECDYFVASGSLPRGVPDDFYTHVREALPDGTRFILDTSGMALKTAVEAGGIFLLKPSRGELEQLAGRKLPDRRDLVEAASSIVQCGGAEHVAVTLGQEGALLVNAEGALDLPAIPVETRSAVGAGDSFLAAMAYGFVSGMNAASAFKLGMAAGAAAALTPGSDLCHPADVWRLRELLDLGQADPLM